jgi:signal transduction histidine kinase
MISNAEKYAELSQDKGMIAFAASKRYNYAFYLKKDYDEALRYVNKAEKWYLETGNREAILNAYRAKAECLIMLRDTSAITYMRKWIAFKDSVFQEEKALNIAKYETLYETEKKDQENKLLQQKNERNRLVLLIVVVVFILLIVLGLRLYNRNILKNKQQELLLLKKLQHDKERIARDLHDHIGGHLSFISYSLDGIKDEDKEKRSEVADSIHQSVRSVINSLRETIWAIIDSNIDVYDFSDKLKLFARGLFKHGKTKVNFTENIKTKREMNSLAGLNLYRICQEILNNAFKHANATEVKIDLQCDEEKLFIVISDNGVGFDITQQNKEQYGLQNIKKRATEFGISLKLETGVNKGTRYELLV